MINELIARKRIYKNDPRRIHERILLSDETKVYKKINELKEQNNIKKAEYLFSELNKFALPKEDDDNTYDLYQGIKQIDAIELVNNDLHITSTTDCTERDGWEICGIGLDRVIMFEIHTEDDKVIRFDFQGLIDNESSYEATYQHQIKDNNIKIITSSEIKTKKLIEHFRNKYECYIYTAFDDRYGNIRTVNNLKGYNDNYACMIEVFSDLVEPSDSKYQSDFGVTDEYFDRVKEVKEDMMQIAMEIEHYYKQQNVKVTLSKWNQGCEYGMAMYIWIPYQ